MKSILRKHDSGGDLTCSIHSVVKRSYDYEHHPPFDNHQNTGKNKPRLAEMGVCKIGLSGSFRRAQAKRKGDIDILVVLDKPTF
jgi:hypothetical protein